MVPQGTYIVPMGRVDAPLDQVYSKWILTIVVWLYSACSKPGT
jgi:hypothetical protein